jgi:sugar/nucleoside kinase (ribokinase family)
MATRNPPTVVGTGLVALDVVYENNNSEPSHLATGGTCGNTMSILAALGWTSIPISRLLSDPAAAVVKADLRRWGVDTRLLQSAPLAATPIIIERLRTGDRPRHSFSWNCPCCGDWLPRFSPLGVRATDALLSASELPAADVFFYDRAFPAAVKLAEHYRSKGALVYFEPSAKSEPAIFLKALQTADVVKYAEDRLARLPTDGDGLENLLLEIQTQGSAGLRYRGKLASIRGDGWIDQRSFALDRIVDPAGSGDWFTAGFLDRLFTKTRKLVDASRVTIDDALTYGQALAAWNCRYVGARGGMYDDGWSKMREDVTAIIEQRVVALEARPQRKTKRTMERICPSCVGSVPQAKARS